MSDTTLEIFLKTGDVDLDQLLAIDEPGTTEQQRSRHGILCKVGGSNAAAAPGVPVVLILGAAGTGKTTLALQMATEIATNRRRPDDESPCLVFLYSLEQSPATLESAHRAFGFHLDAAFADFTKRDAPLDAAGKQLPRLDRRTDPPHLYRGAIHLCHFAPLPISDKDASRAFEDRFEQLCHVTREIAAEAGKDTTKPPLLPVFIVDSLNALATSDLPRNDIYRLFALFRSRGIPAIVTAELRQGGGGGGGQVSEDARFLADIVIELTAVESPGSLLRYLQISKSRVRRQALGKHFYRIRTLDKAATSRFGPPGGQNQTAESKAGFLLYPSLSAIVHMTRAREPLIADPVFKLYDCPDAQSPIYKLMKRNYVEAGACFSLVGPAGTHKLALGLNLATGYRESTSKPGNGRRKLLIISFGSYTAVDLHGVAWFSHRNPWGMCDKPSVEFNHADRRRGTAQFVFRATTHAATADGPEPAASQLIFRMGHLTPEECFYHIQRVIDAEQYSAVLLWDTAQLFAGFPLLRAEGLFLPSLIDLFHQYGLVSVFIGVRDDSGRTRDLDAGIESAADYRMSLSHFPTPYDLASDIFKSPPELLSRGLHGGEQLVSVVLDNVTGKHYGRHPRWLMVKGDSEQREPKTLLCLDTAECVVELARRAHLRAARDAADQLKYLPDLSNEHHPIWGCVGDDAHAKWLGALASSVGDDGRQSTE